MKLQYLILCFLTVHLKTSIVFCQNIDFINIINNPSFEVGTNISKPNSIAQTEFLQFWEDNRKLKIEINNYGDTSWYYLHSPDWFKNDNNWNYNNYSNLLETTNPEQQESISENNFFSIHPNPFDNSFTIKITQTEDSETEISLTNNLGRKVLQIYCGQLEMGQHTIEVSAAELPPGMYFCILETPYKRKVVKVVKM